MFFFNNDLLFFPIKLNVARSLTAPQRNTEFNALKRSETSILLLNSSNKNITIHWQQSHVMSHSLNFRDKKQERKA